MLGRNKNDVLLTELVIVILVFSLVAVTVVQMFVAARQKSAHSGQLERALIVAQDWVERFSGADEGAHVHRRPEAGLVIEAHVEPEVTTQAGKILSATVRVFGSAEYGAEEAAPLVVLPAVRYVPLEEVR
ncbi:MAG: hypothetical protein FWD25_04450 [Clostridia bacterium]|nr:hypothetical protein [Clostridia bacterium]